MKRWYLGQTKSKEYGAVRNVYLEDFEWACGWYWSGGHVEIGTEAFCHFDGCFLEVPDIRGHCLGTFVTPWSEELKGTVIDNGCSVWEPIETFLDDVPQICSTNWWRIKDLFRQFYALQKAAEVFQYGGHCSSGKRLPSEINVDMAKTINSHIETVIVPAIRDIFNQKEGDS